MAEAKKENQGRVTKDADHDRIVMASRAPDGTPNQHDPEFIGDKDVAVEAAKTQLTEQKVSAVDQAIRGVSDEEAGGGSKPDPQVAEIKKAHEAAAASAGKQAEAEVNKLHEGLGDK